MEFAVARGKQRGRLKRLCAEKIHMREWKVTQNCSLKDFTDTHDPQASFSFTALIKSRDIKVNGERVTSPETQLFPGDCVRYYLTKKQQEKPAFFVAYEDNNLLIADKENGVNSEAVFAMLSRREVSTEEQTENNGYCAENNVFFIHRLDRNTRGLLLFAKTSEAAEAAKNAFKERAVEKIYLAVCANNFTINAATEEAYLTKDKERSFVRITKKEEQGAEKIKTQYEVLERNGDLALCKITLHTGKTHQIRAHMAYLGCPVLGDTKYGDKSLNERYKKTRQCLLAKSLCFRFPPSSPLYYVDGKSFFSRFNLSLLSLDE